MTIELRLTDVDPPTAEPARTIYRDIANLPDPTTLGTTIRYFNHDDVGLYMQITGSATGYTFTPVNLGLLATGTNAYKNLDNFASRAKPTVAQLPNGEMSENITLTLKGYTDSGYSTLKWTFDRVVTVIWINSVDAAFTVDELDNFDDGTVQGWSWYQEAGAGGSLSIANDYVLSTPYSLKLIIAVNWTDSGARYYKSFTTLNKLACYAIIDLRCNSSGYGKWIEARNGTSILIHIGQLNDGLNINYIPTDKWIRIVVPLPSNTTLELRIALRYNSSTPSSPTAWLDDFKIISK